jgi:hypothetical protein
LITGSYKQSILQYFVTYSAAATARARWPISVRFLFDLDVNPLTVNAQFAVSHDLFDLSLFLEVPQSLPSQAAINLQSIDEGSNSDETVRLNIFVEFVGGGFVENDGMVGLVLYCGTQSSQPRVLNFSLPLIDVKTRKDIAIPFPLDHFFFCFFAPAAGAYDPEMSARDGVSVMETRG